MSRKGMFRAHLFGGGNVFSIKYPHPSSLINAGGTFLFLDLPSHPWKTIGDYLDGFSIPSAFNFKKSGEPSDLYDMDIKKLCKLVDGYIPTHPHPDHGLGGIELVAYDIFYNQWLRNPDHFSDGKGPLPALVGSHDVIEEIARSTLNRLNTSEVYPDRELGLDDYFEIPELEVGDKYQINDVTITILEADHCTPANGVRIDYDGRALVHTSDTRYLPRVLEANLDAQLIIADCAEIIPGGHTTSDQYLEFAAKHPEAMEKLWLYHIPDEKVHEVVSKGFNVITDPMYIDIEEDEAIERAA